MFLDKSSLDGERSCFDSSLAEPEDLRRSVHRPRVPQPQPGPTVDQLASALARLPGFVVTAPTDATVDGYSGKRLTLTAPDTFAGCTLSSDGYRIWQLPLGAIFSFTTGERMTVWILDVNGQRLVVSSGTFPATTTQDQAEAQAILDSIHVTAGK